MIRLSLVPALIAGLVLAFGAPAAAAEPTPWDQEAATDLAGDLVVAIHELRKQERRQPRQTVGGQVRAQETFRRTLRVLEISAKQLSLNLAEGKTREETMNQARKIRSLVRDARTEGARLMGTTQIETAVVPTEKALAGLGALYFGDESSSE